MTRQSYGGIPSSEITPESVYVNRRRFMKGLGLAAGTLALGACAARPEPPPPTVAPAAGETTATPAAAGQTDEQGNPLTTYEDVTTYNNFYEFGMGKRDPARNAQSFVTEPWTLEVGGLVQKPRTYGVDELLRRFPAEERIYRMRCVETWSMVIPWLGFPLGELLAEVEPTSDAKYVRFETLLDPERMPDQRGGWYDWPYIEGLRLDEAMHDLTLLSVGLYGKMLLPQSGAPIRLVVPWKYGFKSIKSIVRIDLVAEPPRSFWMAAAAHEYGFYANVNPNVPHPRWSQAMEQFIGETERKPTLLFNGYGEQVASLYEGMDLAVYY